MFILINMEFETVIYLFIALLIIYYFLSWSNEKFETFNSKECYKNDINNQFYYYNVNTINRPIRPY